MDGLTCNLIDVSIRYIKQNSSWATGNKITFSYKAWNLGPIVSLDQITLLYVCSASVRMTIKSDLISLNEINCCNGRGGTDF